MTMTLTMERPALIGQPMTVEIASILRDRHTPSLRAALAKAILAEDNQNGPFIREAVKWLDETSATWWVRYGTGTTADLIQSNAGGDHAAVMRSWGILGQTEAEAATREGGAVP